MNRKSGMRVSKTTAIGRGGGINHDLGPPALPRQVRRPRRRKGSRSLLCGIALRAPSIPAAAMAAAPGSGEGGGAVQSAHGSGGAAQPAGHKVGERPPKRKDCAFQCGKSNWDTDDEDSTRYLRWAYPSGHGANCWACERIWATELAHKYPSRTEYQKLQRTDMAVLENHSSRRKLFVERRLGRPAIAYSLPHTYMAHK